MTTTTTPLSKDKQSIKDAKFEKSVNKLAKIYFKKVVPKNQGLPTHGIHNCPFELDSNYRDDISDIEPFLKDIRRDHYLINLSPFGPNNQLRGFRDTLVLAIYLNRTIVMPPFFKHRTDSSVEREGYLYQDPREKLDQLTPLNPT